MNLNAKFSKILSYIFIIVGIVIIAYSIGISPIVSGISKMLIMLGLIVTVLGCIKLSIIKNNNIPFIKTFENIINIIICIFLILFIIIESFIIAYSNNQDTSKTDYVLVLGAGLWGDTPSNTLTKRLEGAMKISKDNKEAKIVVSGGKGPGETVSEAEAMAKYLISKGIDERVIIKENKSTNTLENMKYSKKVIDKDSEGDKSKTVTIVTSNFHMFRANFLAKRCDINTKMYSTDILAAIKPAYYIREFFAVLKSYLFDR